MTCMALINGFSFSQCVAYLGQGVKEFTVMQIYFYIFHFWFLLIILVPILTMRLFSEEYKTGTIEMLLTAPVLDGDVILSKFFRSPFLLSSALDPFFGGVGDFSVSHPSCRADCLDSLGILLSDGHAGRDALLVDRVIRVGFNPESGGFCDDLLYGDCASFLFRICQLFGKGSRLA